jgi:hypothetical protein
MDDALSRGLALRKLCEATTLYGARDWRVPYSRTRDSSLPVPKDIADVVNDIKGPPVSTGESLAGERAGVPTDSEEE